MMETMETWKLHWYDWGLEVISVVSLHDIIAWVGRIPAMAPHRESLERYRERYGVS